MCRFFATQIFWNARIRQFDYYSEFESLQPPNPPLPILLLGLLAIPRGSSAVLN